jgi:hypothetical protein
MAKTWRPKHNVRRKVIKAYVRKNKDGKVSRVRSHVRYIEIRPTQEEYMRWIERGQGWR